MNIRKTSILALTAIAALGASDSAKAADIKFETVVPGYRGYALVRPELRAQLGGRVMWDAARGRWVTDRVSRGETMRITISANKPNETRCRSLAIQGITANNGYLNWGLVNLTSVTKHTVSTNPSFDNVYVFAITSAGNFEKRIPIGRRP